MRIKLNWLIMIIFVVVILMVLFIYLVVNYYRIDKNMAGSKKNKMTCQELIKVVVGTSEEEAIENINENGISYRMVGRDNKLFPVTDDFQPERLNIVIEKDVVLTATCG